MIAMIFVIAAITEKKSSAIAAILAIISWYENHFPAIAAITATTIAEIEKVLYGNLA